MPLMSGFGNPWLLWNGTRTAPFSFILPPMLHTPLTRSPKSGRLRIGIAVKWKSGAEFYGMITNLDHNVGLLRKKLDQLGLAENTIFIFTTDNGTAKGRGGPGAEQGTFRGFNAGMFGQKSTIWEGGHRVPFFIHWPKGGLVGGEDRGNLSAHLDVLPTLAELCGLKLISSLPLDGSSFASHLKNARAKPHRDHLVIQLHGGNRFSQKEGPWVMSCVLEGKVALAGRKGSL